MKKRQFLTVSALAGSAAFAFAAPAAQAKGLGPTLLTVAGAIGKVNRGPFDPLMDQMMHKQKITFGKAHAFDFDALLSLPARTIKPTVQEDGKVHAMRGPALLDVLKAAGALLRPESQLVLHALDGYIVPVTLAQAQRFIVATHLDGQAMALGGFGPLWAIHDDDRAPQVEGKALPSSPWALYYIDVVA